MSSTIRILSFTSTLKPFSFANEERFVSTPRYFGYFRGMRGSDPTLKPASKSASETKFCQRKAIGVLRAEMKIGFILG